MMDKVFAAVFAAGLLLGASVEAKCPTVEKQLKLTTGLSKEQVTAILGTPDDIKGSSYIIFWKYKCPNRIYDYSVEFLKCSSGEWCVSEFGF